MKISEQLKEFALQKGITLIGYTDADEFSCLDWPCDKDPLHFQPCTAAKTGDWSYDPHRLMADACSVVVTGMYMYGFDKLIPSVPGVPRGKIGPWTRGYWEMCRYQGEVVSDFLKLNGYRAMWTNFLPYKTLALKAGIGKIGKNGFIYTKETGSYLELSCILTNAPLEGVNCGTVGTNDCGSCERCIKSCPTGALEGERSYCFDKCLHQWLQGLGTWYQKRIPPQERKKTGNYLMRTGHCMEICPRNAKLVPRTDFPVEIEEKCDSPELLSMVLADEDELRKMLPYHVSKYGCRNNRKNAVMALGNIGDPAAVPVLSTGLSVLDDECRGLCAWALGEIGGENANSSLRKACCTEKDPGVMEEILLAITAIEER